MRSHASGMIAVRQLQTPLAQNQEPESDPAPAPLEGALVRRAAGGDAQAFRRLFDRHAPAVRRFLGDLLRDAGAADEGTQETFVRAHARLGTLRADEKLLPWLFGIARHVFHEELRARRRHPVASDAALAAEVDGALSPEGQLMRREADGLLQQALDELDEERRSALLMRIDHGLDYVEIGDVMGWPLSKVKNEIHRARLAMRARLGNYLGGT